METILWPHTWFQFSMVSDNADPLLSKHDVSLMTLKPSVLKTRPHGLQLNLLSGSGREFWVRTTYIHVIHNNILQVQMYYVKCSTLSSSLVWLFNSVFGSHSTQNQDVSDYVDHLWVKLWHLVALIVPPGRPDSTMTQQTVSCKLYSLASMFIFFIVI